MGVIDDYLRRTLDPFGIVENHVLPLWLAGLDWIDHKLTALWDELGR